MIDGDLASVRELFGHGMQSPAGDMFVHDGEVLCGVLAEAVHAGVDPGPKVEDESRGFMAFARTNFSDGAFGLAVRRSGMSVDEAVAALSQGQWDPFADVEIPLR